MGTIMDLPSGWRQDFQPASFDGNEFFAEVKRYECGQRVVLHEFPKKDEPYTELMGRRFFAFNIRGYFVQSAREPDYRRRRDALNSRLERGTPGRLRLPWMEPKHVVCRSWSLLEEDKRGGYCAIDMQFVEASAKPFKPTPAPDRLVFDRALELRERTLAVMAHSPRQVGNLFLTDGYVTRI